MATVSSDSVLVTIGAPGRTTDTWGDRLQIVDPGIPLSELSGYPVDPLKLWQTQPSLRKVVSFAARNVASVAWHAYVRDSDRDRRRASDSRVEQLLHNPRRWYTGYALMHDLTVDTMLYDVWCVALMDGVLQRIPPRLLDVKSDWLGNVTSVRVRTPDGLLPLDDLPLAWGAGWHSAKGVGVPPIKTLAAILTEQSRAVQWRTEQWDNSARFAGWIGWDKAFSDPTKRTRWQEEWKKWRDSHAGGEPLLENGMAYHQLTNPPVPADMKDIQGRQLTDAETSSSYHIAPELVGARPGTFSNIAAFRQMLFGPTLGPQLVEFQQGFNAEIVPALAEEPGMYAELDREGAMAGSFLEQATYLSTATGGPWLLRAEARSRMNLPWVEGTDELITPLNVTEGGQASPRDTGTQNEKSGEWFTPARPGTRPQEDS